MSTKTDLRPGRQDSRRPLVMEAAARLFATHGFHGTSLRDIAREVGMLPGSIYCHFASKNDLLTAVYEAGVSRILDRVDQALDAGGGPWDRLERACRAHLEVLLEDSPYAKVVIRVLPGDAPQVSAELGRLRERYETRFRALGEDLALTPDRDPAQFRLMLLGALNWTQTWYRPGRASPAEIARHYVRLLRDGALQEGEPA